MTKLTDRGFGLVFLLSFSLFLYLLLSEPFLLYLSIILLAFLIFDLAYSSVVWRRNKCKSECSIKKKLWIWESQPIEIRVECKLGYDVEGIPSWIKDKKVEFEDNLVTLRGKVSFPYFGEFLLNELVVLRRSLFYLFVTKERVSVNIEYKVLPESLYWVIKALNLLLGVGGLTYGSSSYTASKGRAYYYASRDYMPGDSLRDLDWKATLRRRSLIVKVFEDEAYGGLSLIYDLRGPNKHVLDQIASALLSSAIYAVNEGVDLSFVSISETSSFKPHTHSDALLYVIKKVFEAEIFDLREFFEYTEPLSTKELRELLARIVSTDKFEVVRNVKLLSSNNLMISSLLYDVPKIISVAEESKRLGKMLVVVTPNKPWVGIKNLEEAYRTYLTFSNIVSKLKSMNVNVVPWKPLRRKSEVLVVAPK
jgi:uncharacterized protein (DUF58 family)